MHGDGRPASAFAGVGFGNPVQFVEGLREDVIAELFEQRVDRLAGCLIVPREHPVPTCGTL